MPRPVGRQLNYPPYGRVVCGGVGTALEGVYGNSTQVIIYIQGIGLQWNIYISICLICFNICISSISLVSRARNHIRLYVLSVVYSVESMWSRPSRDNSSPVEYRWSISTINVLFLPFL